MLHTRASRRRCGGFTLAEVAVTIALVGIALAWLLQALNSAKLTAANARNIKLARELSLLTLGQIESGLFAKEIDDDRIEGSYADEGYPEFSFEAVIGDENLSPDPNDTAAFDNWRHDQDQKKAKQSSKDKDEKEVEQPYEKIQIKVTFPKIQQSKNEYVIEKWVAWKQIHPEEATDANSPSNAASNASSNGSSSTSGTGSGGAKGAAR
jgi:prepilin-type N-terminal cleavage/methylation domain-containing protein